MGRFSKAAKSEVYKDGEYFPCITATYNVTVTTAEAVDGDNLAFKMTVKVDEVLGGNPKEVDSKGLMLPDAGVEREWWCNLSNKAGPPDFKKFIDMIGKAIDEDVSTEATFNAFCERIVGDQAIKGLKLGLRTYNKPTQVGGDFTKHCWSIRG